MSTSSICLRMAAILRRCSSSSSGESSGGTLPCSSVPTRFLLESARPMSRSRANGGQVDMRSVGRMAGWVLIRSGVMVVRSSVRERPHPALSMVLLRVSRYAFGANFRRFCSYSNHSHSTKFNKFQQSARLTNYGLREGFRSGFCTCPGSGCFLATALSTGRPAARPANAASSRSMSTPISLPSVAAFLNGLLSARR